jgi:hypothetical protein
MFSSLTVVSLFADQRMCNCHQLNWFQRLVADTRALLALGLSELDTESANATLGCVLKYKGDIEKLRQMGLDGIVTMALMPGHDPSSTTSTRCA